MLVGFVVVVFATFKLYRAYRGRYGSDQVDVAAAETSDVATTPMIWEIGLGIPTVEVPDRSGFSVRLKGVELSRDTDIPYT